MAILVVRHALSEANNRENVGTPAFGAPDAPLMELGHAQARALGRTLAEQHGICPASTTVAVSTMRRAQETARSAGFTSLSIHPVLNEVDQPRTALRHIIDQREPTAAVLALAEAVLAEPPPESIWITHGMLIAALCRVLGLPDTDRFVPRFCEIRELPL